MPGRPDEHVVAERAISAVRRVWAETGAAVEEVHKDYGEDLAIQTRLNGRIDDSRIWVQVKGRTEVRGMGSPGGKAFVRNIPLDLVRRWAMMPELVVLVLWDVSADCGWYTFPADYYYGSWRNGWQTRSMSIPVYRENCFDIQAAHEISWYGRISCLEGIVNGFYIALDEAVNNNESESAGPTKEAMINVIADFMVTLGILELRDKRGKRYLLTARFKDCLKSAYESDAMDLKEHETEIEHLRSVVALCILNFAADFPGCGLSTLIISQIGRVLEIFLGISE